MCIVFEPTALCIFLSPVCTPALLGLDHGIKFIHTYNLMFRQKHNIKPVLETRLP